jgi:hypothetical protein
VRYLDGVVEQARGDTLTLRLWSSGTVSGAPLVAPRVIVVTDSATRVEGEIRSGVSGIGTGGRWALGLALLLLLALLGAAAFASGPWPEMTPQGVPVPGAVPAAGAAGR